MAISRHGNVRGNTIELDEPLDAADGQEVEIIVTLVHPQSVLSEPLAEIYSILGERYDSGEHDVAAHHNEHQP
jgi:hypothetical protein